MVTIQKSALFSTKTSSQQWEGLRTDPVIRPQMREPIKQHYIPSSEHLNSNPKKQYHCPNTKIRNLYLLRLCRFEIRPVTTKIKMRPLPPLKPSHPLQGNIIDAEINRPRYELVEEQGQKSDDGCIFDDFPHLAMLLFLSEIFGFESRDERDILV